MKMTLNLCDLNPYTPDLQFNHMKKAVIAKRSLRKHMTEYNLVYWKRFWYRQKGLRKNKANLNII